MLAVQAARFRLTIGFLVFSGHFFQPFSVNNLIELVWKRNQPAVPNQYQSQGHPSGAVGHQV
jgi:hypothetical protein